MWLMIEWMNEAENIADYPEIFLSCVSTSPQSMHGWLSYAKVAKYRQSVKTVIIPHNFTVNFTSLFFANSAGAVRCRSLRNSQIMSSLHDKCVKRHHYKCCSLFPRKIPIFSAIKLSSFKISGRSHGSLGFASIDCNIVYCGKPGANASTNILQHYYMSFTCSRE